MGTPVINHDPWCHFPPGHTGSCVLGGKNVHEPDCPMYPDPTGHCTHRPHLEQDPSPAPRSTDPQRRAMYWRDRPYPEWLKAIPELEAFQVTLVDQWYDRSRELWVTMVAGPTLPVRGFGAFPVMFHDAAEVLEYCERARQIALAEYFCGQRRYRGR